MTDFRKMLENLAIDSKEWLDSRDVVALDSFLQGYTSVDAAARALVNCATERQLGPAAMGLSGRILIGEGNDEPFDFMISELESAINHCDYEPRLNEGHLWAAMGVDEVIWYLLRRPGAVVGYESLSRFFHYQNGWRYAAASLDPGVCTMVERQFALFEDFLRAEFGVQGSTWFNMVRAHESDDARALGFFGQLWMRYRSEFSDSSKSRDVDISSDGIDPIKNDQKSSAFHSVLQVLEANPNSLLGSKTIVGLEWFLKGYLTVDCAVQGVVERATGSLSGLAGMGLAARASLISVNGADAFDRMLDALFRALDGYQPHFNSSHLWAAVNNKNWLAKMGRWQGIWTSPSLVPFYYFQLGWAAAAAQFDVKALEAVGQEFEGFEVFLRRKFDVSDVSWFRIFQAYHVEEFLGEWIELKAANINRLG